MRLALKTTSYSITHIIVATSVAYLLTGNLLAALGIGLVEPIVQTAVYSLHEYLWEHPKVEQSSPLSGHEFLSPNYA